MIPELDGVYDIYHDESKEGGYWHGFLFVPRATRQFLLDLLERARLVVGYPYEVHYVKLGAKTKPHYETATIAEAWTSIGVAALQQQKLRKYPPRIFLGRRGRAIGSAQYGVLAQLLGCKLVVFRERDNHNKMYAGMSKLQRVETTFRMGLKGGVHVLFDENEPIVIGNVFIDGEEQYWGEFGRPFDINRTLIRFAQEKRPYVSFLGQPRLIPQRSDPRKIEDHQNPEDSEFLQLCDVLIGGVRFHSYCPSRKHVRYSVSLPCRELLLREQENLPRMEQSRFYKGFTLSEAWLEGEDWHFSCLAVPTDEPRQIELQQSSFL